MRPMDLQPLRDYLDSKDIRGSAIISFLKSQAEDLTKDTLAEGRTVIALKYRSPETSVLCRMDAKYGNVGNK